MAAFRSSILAVVTILGGLLGGPVHPLPAQEAPVRGYLADSTLAFLEPLIGEWHPAELPDSLEQLTPPIVGHAYEWTVGRKAIRLREIYRAGSADAAQLDGLVYWNPATERVEWVAVAGHGGGEGRLFVGEYRQLADGAIQRTYDVFYRSLADTPGEAFGGSRRRYRETYRFESADRIASTLDWFHDGAWRGFGPFATGGATRLTSVKAGALVRIDAEVEIHASAADVWAALTTPEGLAGWVAPESHVELRIGGPYELYFFPDEADRGMEGTTVLSFIPEELLATTGEAADTWSVWRLDAVDGDVTRVRLTGLGTSEEWRRRAAYFEEGTPGVLEELKRYVEGAVGG